MIMKHTSRALCLLLALLLTLCCLPACGETTEAFDTDTDAASEADSLEPADKALSQIDPIDCGGSTFTVLYSNGFPYFPGYDKEINVTSYTVTDKSSSQVLNDAVFERNSMFENTCKLKLSAVGHPGDDIQSALMADISAGSRDYHFILNNTINTASMAANGILYNFLSLDVDYEQPWWDSGTLDFAMDGKVFFMDGAHNVVDDDVTFVMMFNKELASRYQTGSFYEKVKSGDWTLDYFSTVIQNISSENGDGVWDAKDVYGFAAPNTIAQTLFYGAGLRYVVNSRSSEAPELGLTGSSMDKALALVDKEVAMIHGGNSTFIAPAGGEFQAQSMFTGGRSLFWCEVVSYLSSLNAEMNDDYGVLPIPKYTSDQSQYLTWVHPSGSTLSIPTNVDCPGDLSDILSTFVILSYKKVTPAYYDVLLTRRNVRDNESAEMLDLIFRNRVFDMAMYFRDLGFVDMINEVVLNNTGTFASKYTSLSKTFPRKIRTIMKAFERS